MLEIINIPGRAAAAPMLAIAAAFFTTEAMVMEVWFGGSSLSIMKTFN
jgi:hypothetical protein